MLTSEAVTRSLARAADPATSRDVLARLVEDHPELIDELATDSLVRDAIIALASASRSLTTAFLHDPSLLEPLRDHAGFAIEIDDAVFGRSWDVARRDFDGDGTDNLALRWWKSRELLRIAARDLLGVADMDSVARELARVAATCLAAAHDIARADLGRAVADVRMAVIGMGKLGGRELNYASDVDVLLVHDGSTEAAQRLARGILDAMTEPDNGSIVFRTDADLRPEGRSGPLSRSLESYETWYERWAQAWEFQALLKARPVAGDAELGAEFFDTTRRFVYPDVLDAGAIREIRAMKARAEEELRRKGLTDRELKRGRGGIRDVEFSVQLLQLVHGRHDPEVRSPTTLVALESLAEGGYIDEEDTRHLSGAYRHLRTVEHRLQLRDEHQTHTLPDDPEELERLARVLGYRDDARVTAADQFRQAHTHHQATVRAIHERLYFEPLLDTLAGHGALDSVAAQDRLAAIGFTDVARTQAALRELTAGLTRRSRLMKQLLPLLLEWCSVTPDPDLALLQLRRLAEGPTRSTALAETFRDTPFAAERVCRILGSSRTTGDALLRAPDLLDVLADDDEIARVRARSDVLDEALETLQWRDNAAARRDGLRRFTRREQLRIAARDLLDLGTIESTGQELSTVADAAVEAALRCLDPQVPFAVVGMGRYGGSGLSYASDLDVLFVYDGEGPADFNEAERTATALIRELSTMTSEGRAYAIDADLRPEGKQGPLARSLSSFGRYYREFALTWEFQALTRARAVAGDDGLHRHFAELITPFVYNEDFSEEQVREIRRMKVRVEQERIPPGEDPEFHLKLGKGSLSDVEWTVQLLQLLHGADDPTLRVPSTVGALLALSESGVLDDADAEALEASYRYCERARNARFLLTGAPGDSLPTDAVVAERLGRLLGYVHQPQTNLREDYRRLTRRARAVTDRLFYGHTPDD